MPIYTIEYNTVNTYSQPINEAVLEFLVLPVTISGQELLEYSFHSSPNVDPYLTNNIFGFELIHFRVRNLDQQFQFTLNAKVEKQAHNPYDFSPLPINEESEMMNSEHFIVDHYPYLNFTPFTSFPNIEGLPIKRADEGVFSFSKRVGGYIFEKIKYDNLVQDPLRKLSETLNEGKGVCQDFAHLMLGILRHSNVPARYVSGYLNQGNGNIGAAAVHAWVEVLVPGVGWKGFDPTNNLLENEHYIKISHGVDIQDCTALRGVIKGAGQNQTDYKVLVEEQSKESNQ